ncbi:MarR family winged helix-turn-helix transcriptional regulator [Alteribacter natronophilus]|uniref:MarR family winged helix-turn-helix transcriptional regulator n=1 Tax=Alteribacter natronophilus TaxID=2583810 RepID=UPI00110E879B|nr:MarR family transcriptional regulator [Alteribacter natronophilus]TMW70978.1 MarR family transcriptional regulator [Alteribacter natronophilus]
MLPFKDYISIKVHKADLMMTSLIKAKLAPYNLAPEQNLIMMLLWEKDGQSQHQLVDALDKDKTNIARMASNLEKKGFVRRVHCTEDRRSVKVFLTDEGRELGEKVIPVAEKFNESVTEGITDEELAELERLLLKMKANAEAQL